MSIVLLNAGMSIPQLFLVIAGLNALVAIYIYTLLPEFLMRFLAWRPQLRTLLRLEAAT